MHGNRIHKLDVPVGNLTVAYVATIVGRTDPAPVPEYDLSMYLRPSRYAEADKFYGFAATEFGNYGVRRAQTGRSSGPRELARSRAARNGIAAYQAIRNGNGPSPFGLGPPRIN